MTDTRLKNYQCFKIIVPKKYKNKTKNYKY